MYKYRWSLNEISHLCGQYSFQDPNPLTKTSTRHEKPSSESVIAQETPNALQSIPVAFSGPTKVEDKSLLLRHHELQEQGPEAQAGDDASSMKASFDGTRRHHAIFQCREATNDLHTCDVREPRRQA